MQTTVTRSTRRFLPLLVAAGCALPLFATACNKPPGSGPAEAAAPGGARSREIPRVRVIEIEKREMTQVLETMTKLESELEVELYPQTAGTVVEVRVEEGDAVRAGDVLALLDDRDQNLAVRDATVALDEAKNTAALATLAVDEAKARMDSADLSWKQAVRDHERNVKLFEGRETESALSKSALEASALARDRAEHDHQLAVLAWRKSQLDDKASATAVERASVALDRAEVAHSHCRMTAPFDGVIAERRIRVGDSAGTGAAAYVLTDPGNLRAVFRRPQEELSRFTGAGTATLEVSAIAEALPGEVFRGEVERVSPTIDQDSGQFRVTARLRAAEGDASTARLLPGMLVRLEIVTDRHPDALVVPKRALRREGERRFVFVVEEVSREAADEEPTEAADETAEDAGGEIETDAEPPAASNRDEFVRELRRVDVELGYDDDDFVEIHALDGESLTAGTPVLLVGSRDLTDGALVDIGEPEQRAGETPAEETATEDEPEPANDDE